MIGIKNRNIDRTLFIANGQLVFKNFAAGNIQQRGSEVNDWVLGELDSDSLAVWSKYQGGDKKDKASYDISDSIDPTAYPDI